MTFDPKPGDYAVQGDDAYMTATTQRTANRRLRLARGRSVDYHTEMERRRHADCTADRVLPLSLLCERSPRAAARARGARRCDREVLAEPGSLPERHGFWPPRDESSTDGRGASSTTSEI